MVIYTNPVGDGSAEVWIWGGGDHWVPSWSLVSGEMTCTISRPHWNRNRKTIRYQITSFIDFFRNCWVFSSLFIALLRLFVSTIIYFLSFHQLACIQSYKSSVVQPYSCSYIALFFSSYSLCLGYPFLNFHMINLIVLAYFFTSNHRLGVSLW